jgi:LacI family transcriptional regulator
MNNAVNDRPAPRPTMRDVAERAGVSFKTVSRVVNDEGGVSPDLADRVAAAVRALGYRPDGRARHLRQGGTTTGAIGFILVDVANPFFSAILRGIEEVARANDTLVLAGSTDFLAEREEQLVEAFVSRRVDGLIVVPSGDSNGALATELDRGTPVVFLDLEPVGLRVDLVRSDHRGGAELATKHLIAHGHRDIAFIGDDPSTFSAACRLDGFLAATADAGITVPADRIVTGRHSSETWRTIVADELRRPSPPTAIFTAQNFITVGAAHALHDLERHRDIAQVGFDDVEMADVVEPGITVVPQQPRELGRRAAERLFRRIHGDRSAPISDIIASDIIARGSGEIGVSGHTG